jgi:hypothetical protein
VSRQALITISLFFAAVSTGLAQTAAPDFSGTWVLNTTKSTLAKEVTIKSETIGVECKKSKIIFHYKTDGKKSTETYIADGEKHVTKEMHSGQLVSKASWHDSALVIESTLDIKIPNVTVTVTGLKSIIDRWAMAADGKTLTHETGGDPKETFVYDKQ